MRVVWPDTRTKTVIWHIIPLAIVRAKGGIARPRRLRLEIQFRTLGRGLGSIFIRGAAVVLADAFSLAAARKTNNVFPRGVRLERAAWPTYIPSIRHKSWIFKVLDTVEKRTC